MCIDFIVTTQVTTQSIRASQVQVFHLFILYFRSNIEAGARSEVTPCHFKVAVMVRLDLMDLETSSAFNLLQADKDVQS